MKETVMDDALIGTIVERRFVIDKVIGRGGISTVYKVKHLHADIEACIKILHSSYTSTEESVERFRREAAITNAINHANVVHMLSYGVLRGELERSEGFEPETVKRTKTIFDPGVAQRRRARSHHQKGSNRSESIFADYQGCT